jgi:branched-chain amino acid transport system permease protein
LGINVRLIFTVVFALGAAIASLGGIISGGFLNIEPAMGDAFLLQAIAVVIIGGLGSYAGTAIASIMLGISRAVAGYFSRQAYNTDGLAPIVVLSLLCLILIVKPSGLFGKEH